MKLLVVGWDGATPAHVDRYPLSFWDQLQYKGKLFPMEPFNKAGYISSANAWTTITTGARLEEHRILGFVYGQYTGHPLAGAVKWLAQREMLPPIFRRVLVSEVLGRLATDQGRVTKDEKHIQSNDIPFKRVWEFLSGKALVFGLPLTYPAWETNGTLVSGIPAPQPQDASYPLLYPPGLEQTVYTTDYSGYHVDMNAPVNDRTVSEEAYCDAYLDQTESNTNKFIKLAQGTDNDLEFGFLMLRGIDDVLHATKDETLIEKIYRKVDEMTAKLVETIDPDATLLLSDHGMRPTSFLRVDKNLRMDHASPGVWGGSEDFRLRTHAEVTPAILDWYGITADTPQRRDDYDLSVGDVDTEAVHEQLRDLGYT